MKLSGEISVYHFLIYAQLIDKAESLQPVKHTEMLTVYFLDIQYFLLTTQNQKFKRIL